MSNHVALEDVLRLSRSPGQILADVRLPEAQGTFAIDRTRWNVRYGSGRLKTAFFAIASPSGSC